MFDRIITGCFSVRNVCLTSQSLNLIVILNPNKSKGFFANDISQGGSLSHADLKFIPVG